MIKEMSERLLFPKEAIDALLICEEKMRANADDIDRATKSFYTKGDLEYLNILEKIATECSVNRYECDMVFLLMAAPSLLDKYREAGYSEELFDETMADLRYKMYECKTVYGVWGSFVTFWFKDFYLLNIFKLGRMEYERRTYPFEDVEGVVKNGQIILSCHIPSSGPMKVDDIKDSLRRAYRFYKDDIKDGKLTVACFSWLLYPPLFADYKEGSNIKDFYNLFNIIDYRDNEKNGDFWRVFGVKYSTEALDSVVVDNSLKRKVYDHLKSGGNMGYGIGIITVDENY